MTQIIKSRKERANFTIEQKLDYAKLMVNCPVSPRCSSLSI